MPGRTARVDLMPAGLIRAAWAPLCIAVISLTWSGWAASVSGSLEEAAWTGGALIPVVLDAGAQLWRLICAGWLHVDLGHAALNAPGLLIAGVALARLRGGAAVWVVWGLGAIAGSVASWQLTRTWALGASGGNAALAGAVLWVVWRRWAALDKGTRRLALIGSVPWLVLLIVPRAGPVDHAAHLAGALTGPLVVAAGGRIATAVLLAQVAGFGLMIHAWAQPPIQGMIIPSEAPPYCPKGLTDGLLVRCHTLGAAPVDDLPIDGRVHHRWQIGAQTLLAPPGPRAQRALAEIRGRFFDGSPDLR